MDGQFCQSRARQLSISRPSNYARRQDESKTRRRQFQNFAAALFALVVLLAVILFVGIMIYAFYRSRLARLLELECVRTRIATDLHDDIGANLTRIALLSEVANQPPENGNRKNLLPSIANIAREMKISVHTISSKKYRN